MPPTEDGRAAVVAEADGQVLRLVFPDGAWEVRFPDEWRPADSDEDDLWCWELPGLASARVRVRQSPHVQLEVDVVNLLGDVATIHPPTVTSRTSGTEVPWFAGSAGEIVQVLPRSTVLWTQQRGSCVARGSRGFALFPEPLLLRPAQGASAAWRRHDLPAAALPPEPSWVPRQRYFHQGETLDVDHSDAALLGMGLHIGTTAEGSEVEGPPGLHDLAFLDARGTALVEVGWYRPLDQLAVLALGLPGQDPNVLAWLLGGVPVGDEDLDALDVALADALERPTVWGVLAGMRAVALTDLPVAAEVRSAARTVWREETDPALRWLLITHAVLTGWEPGIVGEWVQSAGQAPITAEPQEVLASIGLGRVTSAPEAHGGREVALAALWLAARAESVTAAEWERALEAARARLMCSLSTTPNDLDVAWLLAESLLL